MAGRRSRLWVGIASAAIALGIVLAAGLFVWERCGLRGCPDVRVLRGYVPDEASVVLDGSGEEVTKLFLVRRVLISLEELPDHVPAAFVAVEDRRFWEHGGVDWRRAAGAAWSNLRAFDIEEGFSTITMQLARNLFPEELPRAERTLSRKLAEMRVATEIERTYEKHEILELYLNQIYFGNGAWGIEAAAREYFGKGASDLTLAESALLAGLPPAPSRLNPRVDPERAMARRQGVLRRMVRAELLTAEEAAAAAEEPLELSRGELRAGDVAPYFVEEVRRMMEDRMGRALYTGGYRIHTTLDRTVQRVAEEELERQLSMLESGGFGRWRHPVYRRGESVSGYVQGAVVVLDLATGDVLALVGGRDFEDSKFNRATQAKRQPGSAFKPFVYAAAVSAGYSPVHVLDDVPLQRVMPDGRIWAPRNYGNSYSGAISLRQALVHSKNVATVRLAEQVGLPAVIDTGRRLGLAGPIPEVPSVSIGAADVGVLELTAAYGAFATLGERVRPRLVRRIEDRDGRVVWEARSHRERVLDPAAAFIVTDILRDVVDRGTGGPVRGAGYGGPAGGKTGTTNDATDVWFIGFTPGRLAGVWIGFDRRRTILPGATGGRLAAPVWGRILARIGGGAGAPWSPPPGVESRPVDAYGTVLSPDCLVDGMRREWFLVGTAPTGRCPYLGRWAPDTLWLPRDTATDPRPDTSYPPGPPWPAPDTAPRLPIPEPVVPDTLRPPDDPRRPPPPARIDTVRLPEEHRPRPPRRDRRRPPPQPPGSG